MSEEEKQAIETLKIIKNDETIRYYYTEKAINNIDAILNLIDKQQKEIEELKEKNKQILGDNIDNFRKLFAEEFSKQFISKDKIKEKIEFYASYGKIKNSNEYVMSEEIEVLQGLLKEGE